MSNFLVQLADSISRNSTRIAFHINEASFTYAQLEERVAAIQVLLKMQKANLVIRRVGIISWNDLETYAALLACWFEGIAYVPLNPALPEDRISLIIESAGIGIVLTSKAHYSVGLGSAIVLEISGAVDDVKAKIHLNDLPVHRELYVLFTSGSTGIPKGVPINIQNIETFLRSYNALGFECSAEDRYLQMFDLSFDVSVASYLVPLLQGASIYTVDSGSIKYLEVYKLLTHHQITFATIVPSIINMLRPYLDEISLPHVRYCVLTAEASNVDLITKWRQCIPNAVVYNLYGPTEATIWCTGYKVEAEPKGYNQMLAIGQAFKEVNTVLINEAGKSVSNGEKGELCLESDQLTVGYLNDPERNKTAFITRDDKRFYKTGDVCFRDEGGFLYYCGRKDQQVKIQGFRIELSEIESTIRERYAINAIALVYKNELQSDQIAVILEGYDGDLDEFCTDMRRYVPYYMIPSVLKSVSQFPINTSGKIDRQQLKKAIEAV